MPFVSTLLFASTALAVAMPRINSTALRAREDQPEVWTKDDGTGDTRVVFGDNRVYIGSCTPDNIFDSVWDNCYDEGFCNSESWELQCEQGDMTTHTITITAPEGQFQQELRRPLVSGMKQGVMTDDVTTSETITAESGGGCVGCTWTTEDITVYHIPSSIGISHDNDGTVPDVITLSITNEDDGGGVCELMTRIAGDVAGAINGAAAGAIDMAAIACG